MIIASGPLILTILIPPLDTVLVDIAAIVSSISILHIKNAVIIIPQHFIKSYI